MNIYIYQKDPMAPVTSEEMIREALKAYNRETKSGLSDSAMENEMILRTDKGKPYFAEIPLSFSLSHSGNMMICAIGKKDMGIDIQHIRHAKTIEVAQRFFTKKESDYVNQHGEAAFFDLWARKEAFVKYIGEGISYGFHNFNLVEDGIILDRMEKPFFCQFQKIEMGEDTKCYVCSRKREKAWIKKL